MLKVADMFAVIATTTVVGLPKHSDIIPVVARALLFTSNWSKLLVFTSPYGNFDLK
jgi:hypothetical protein